MYGKLINYLETNLLGKHLGNCGFHGEVALLDYFSLYTYINIYYLSLYMYINSPSFSLCVFEISNTYCYLIFHLIFGKKIASISCAVFIVRLQRIFMYHIHVVKRVNDLVRQDFIYGFINLN